MQPMASSIQYHLKCLHDYGTASDNSMNAKQQFDSGNLAGAVEAAVAEVKRNPSDNGRRTFLFELLCFAGELERAQRQLDAIAQLDSQSEWAVQVYTNILHAEQARRRFFAAGLRPEFLFDPPAYAQSHLEAANRMSEGRPDEAAEILRRAEAERPETPGEVNGRPCDDIRDCDDLLGPFLEVIIMRDYVWLPWEQIRELETSAPERPRDLLWLPAKFLLSDGSPQRGYLPLTYCDSHGHPDDLVKLGRMTDWHDGEGLVRGVGLHTLLAGEDALGLSELRTFKAGPG
jgi:type VI secretion system protein ImpE